MFGKPQMNIHYQETLTLEIPFRYIISFFGRINSYVFIGLNCLLREAAIRVEVFCKKRCSLRFRKFCRKKPVLESFFNKVSGLTPILKNICQRLLLHCTRTTVTYRFYFHLLPHHHHCYC